MAVNPELSDYKRYEQSNPFMYHNHIEIVKIAEDNCRVKVTLAPESMNLYGNVHGGLMFSMADVACGITARIDGNEYVTQSTHMNYLRNTIGNEIYCDTEIVKRGRTMVIVHFRITDDSDRLLADGVIDMIRIDKKRR